jgi:hypothetical protein
MGKNFVVVAGARRTPVVQAVVRGPKGDTGPKGNTGPKGDTGAKGEKGDSGSPALINQANVLTALGLSLSGNAGKVLAVNADGSGFEFVAVGGGATPTLPVVSISSAQAATEGDSGTTVFVFAVTRTGAITGASSVAWAVAGTGANPANAADFVGGALPSGAVLFAAGETSKTITVNVAGDTGVESNENFLVTLSTPSGCTIGTATSQGAITNDDSGSPTLINPNGAISTPELLLAASDRESYPPPFTVNLPADIEASTDILVHECWPLDDPANVTRTFVALSSSPPYNVGLSAITSPQKTVHRIKVQGPAGSGRSSYWTQPILHGDATAPVVTSAASLTLLENGLRTILIDTSEPTQIAVGGETTGLTRTSSATAFLTQHSFTITPDYETDNSIVLTITTTDQAGIVGSPHTLTISVTNDPADDPVVSTWAGATGTGIDDGSITTSNGERTATMTRAEGPRTIIAPKVNSAGKKWIAYYMEGMGGNCGVGLIDSITGNLIYYNPDTSSDNGPAWSVPWNNDNIAEIRFEVDFDNLKVQAFVDGVSAGAPRNLPVGMTSLKPLARIGSLVGPFAIINTGQLPPTGGVTAGFTPWG